MKKTAAEPVAVFLQSCFCYGISKGYSVKS